MASTTNLSTFFNSSTSSECSMSKSRLSTTASLASKLIKSSSLVSTGPDARFHGLSCVTRVGIGRVGEGGPEGALDTRVLEDGEDPGEIGTGFLEGEETEEPNDWGRMSLLSNEFWRLSYGFEPFVYCGGEALIVLLEALLGLPFDDSYEGR